MSRSIKYASQDWHPEHDAGWDSLITRMTHLVTCGMPFSYPRFGDGEFLSITGRRGTNCDGHGYFRDSLGIQLRRVLMEISRYAESADASNLFVGGWLDWRARSYLDSERIAEKIPWCSTGAFQFGLADLFTLDFLSAVKVSPATKIIVGPSHLKPVADGLGATLIEVPVHNCWLDFDRVQFECSRELCPGAIYLYAAGMMSEILAWEMWKTDRSTTQVDVGNVLSAIAGAENTRTYMVATESPERRAIAEHYWPLLNITPPAELAPARPSRRERIAARVARRAQRAARIAARIARKNALDQLHGCIALSQA
jgi:hypothetical protein